MPTYDYGCPSCGNQKEVNHSISELGKIQVACDSCGNSMQKLLSVPALVGFDNVGRSLSRKDKGEKPSAENSTAPACNGCACKADAA